MSCRDARRASSSSYACRARARFDDGDRCRRCACRARFLALLSGAARSRALLSTWPPPRLGEASGGQKSGDQVATARIVVQLICILRFAIEKFENVRERSLRGGVQVEKSLLHNGGH